jgi:NADPH:quinone reductase-like Zn-dependent oxidoreductase
VTNVRVGEAVYEVTNKQFTGSYAQYTAADAGMIARKPQTLDHVQAASVPVVAVTPGRCSSTTRSVADLYNR